MFLSRNITAIFLQKDGRTATGYVQIVQDSDIDAYRLQFIDDTCDQLVTHPIVSEDTVDNKSQGKQSPWSVFMPQLNHIDVLLLSHLLRSNAGK